MSMRERRLEDEQGSSSRNIMSMAVLSAIATKESFPPRVLML
jgi:hypothetical protein